MEGKVQCEVGDTGGRATMHGREWTFVLIL